MKKMNIRFSINTPSGKVSFSALDEIQDIQIKTRLRSQLTSWEKRVKESAVKQLLIKEIGQVQADKIKVRIT